MKILVIDGMNVIRRMAEAVLASETEDLPQKIANLAYTALFNLCQRHKTDKNYIALEGDSDEYPSWRVAVWAGYKADRGPVPAELLEALPSLKARLGSLATVLEEQGKEADDVWARVVSRHCNQDDAVILASGDKDSFGLLGLFPKNVRIWHPAKEVFLDSSHVEKKFGVTPAQFWDYQALVGDSVDGIPGVKSVGPKTAASLLKEFGTLEGIYANLGAIKDPTRKHLEKNRDLAYISKKLATLETETKQVAEQLGLF